MKLTKIDKAVVAFLVSLGIFTTIQAKQYITQLTKKQKNQLISVKDLNDKNIVLCENVTFPSENPNKKNS